MPQGSELPRVGRRRLNVLQEPFFPAYVVWELTLRCDHACGHCGSRASRARPEELRTDEALAVVAKLAAMGAREVVLIGGEAYLHAGFLPIVKALRAASIVPVMTTGGHGVTPELAQCMADAGLARVSVSIDGMPDAHDHLRRKRGSFAQACLVLEHVRAAGMGVSVNTTLHRGNQQDLEAMYDLLRQYRVEAWQVQLMAPLGRAADMPELLLQPWELLDVIPRIAQLKARGLHEGLLIMPGNNLGYFGPEEGLLRSATPDATDYFMGCQAGRFIMGIESHGAVKGCPSLQSSAYVGGNVRQQDLQEIWHQAPKMQTMRARSVEDLWGFCRTCPFAEPCLGGCSFTAHGFFGRPGNNPYCHYRARHFQAMGLRERLVQRSRAPGEPFDSAHFALVVENITTGGTADAPTLGVQQQAV